MKKELAFALVVLLVCFISACGSEQVEPLEEKAMDDAAFAKIKEGMSIEEVNIQAVPRGTPVSVSGNIMGEGGSMTYDSPETGKRYIVRYENGKVVAKEEQELPASEIPQP